MADRFDKFTERARRVLTLAQEEAQRFNHNYIGTEHLLLGLICEHEGVAAKVLQNLGVQLQQVRTAVEFIIGRGDRAVVGEIGLTPRAKKVIELTVDEARRMKHHYVGTEHLLLGLVREGEGIATGVLESLGVNLERVRAETTRILSQSMPPGQQDMRRETPRMQNISLRLPPDAANAFPIGLAIGLALSPHVKDALERAWREASYRHVPRIAAEHVMLALLLPDGELAVALAQRGVDIDRLRETVESLLEESQGPSDEASPEDHVPES